ncbi:hypothetical protein RBSWK_05625 [Rhodopirellula baltica SWK14]|uniref:Uncharacterized protein n=1 Tax=Rhodopirellula baltica SWK14 TaxID=993516 RepID=L7C8I0_RHOBT|nr:hypothetical protein RBSWK_05625 [Rhodopirellula baltica SWK14]
MRETASKAKKIALRRRNAYDTAPFRPKANSPTGSFLREINRSGTCRKRKAILPPFSQLQRE